MYFLVHLKVFLTAEAPAAYDANHTIVPVPLFMPFENSLCVRRIAAEGAPVFVRDLHMCSQSLGRHKSAATRRAEELHAGDGTRLTSIGHPWKLSAGLLVDFLRLRFLRAGAG